MAERRRGVTVAVPVDRAILERGEDHLHATSPVLESLVLKVAAEGSSGHVGIFRDVRGPVHRHAAASVLRGYHGAGVERGGWEERFMNVEHADGPALAKLRRMRRNPRVLIAPLPASTTAVA